MSNRIFLKKGYKFANPWKNKILDTALASLVFTQTHKTSQKKINEEKVYIPLSTIISNVNCNSPPILLTN